MGLLDNLTKGNPFGDIMEDVRLNSTGEDLGRMGDHLHSTGSKLAEFGPTIATS